MSHWRETSARIIKKVLEETKGQDEKAIKKALKEAYPFGIKSMHPYQVWLSEIKNQRLGKQKKQVIINNQSSLF